MSSSLATTYTGDTVPATAGSRKALRALYFFRFGFAVVWAVALLAIAAAIDPVPIALLVVYPLFDATAAVIDYRSSGAARQKVALFVNMGLSLLAGVGLAVAVTAGIPTVLRVWGLWAITAGIVQLVVAVLRYRLGGQWALILSGGISVLAGSGFILMAGGPEASLTPLAGYAVLGGVFFLVSAIRLHRRTEKIN